jgi:hypothetical protein
MKDEYLHIRLSKTFKDKILLKAQQTDQTVSQYILDLIKKDLGYQSIQYYNEL